LNGPYVVINHLIESIWKVAHLKNSLTYILLGGKEYQSNKKWPRLGLLKLRSKFGHSKIHNYLLVKVFIVVFFNPYIVFHHVSYIKSLYKILRWNHNKKCIWMLMQNPNYSPYVHFKSQLPYDWCMFTKFHPLINILIQVDNFNP
jgi:hypothetical protein